MKMSLVKEQSAFLQDFAKLLTFAFSGGFDVTAGELWRPEEMQKIYFKAGKSKTMDSNHLRRLAGDLNFFLNGKWVQDKATLQPIGDYWESLNPKNRWGGNFKKFLDTPHFERNVK